MAATGEERLLTLYGDVHYYFSEPTPRPVHHRFDKESYIYLYRDAANRRGRLEVANHAGTPEQDAFTGYMNGSKVVQTHKHPTLVTVVVDAIRGGEPTPSNDHHWRLPSTDPRDEGKYLFRLHTLDFYFWTVDDANSFVRAAQETLGTHQLEIDAPPPSAARHSQAMSPVVQNLENVAISDPAYSNQSRSRGSRSGSQALPGSGYGSPASVQSPVPPPPQTNPPVETRREEPVAFQPLAYNPAAPAAPEVHAHREKTPPPQETSPGLSGAPYQQHPGSLTSIPPPPGSVPGSYSPFASPPPTGNAAAAPYGSPPLSAMSGTSMQTSLTNHRLSQAAQTYTPATAQSSSPHLSHGPASPPSASASFHGNPPLASPTSEILGSGPPGPRQPLQHHQPQYADYLSSRPQSQQPSAQQSSPPPGGYAHFDYSQPQHQSSHHHHSPHSTGDSSVHSQVYRPTEHEVKKGKVANQEGKAGSGQAVVTGKWDARANKAEKGLNRFLKKVEKKIG